MGLLQLKELYGYSVKDLPHIRKQALLKACQNHPVIEINKKLRSLAAVSKPKQPHNYKTYNEDIDFVEKMGKGLQFKTGDLLPDPSYLARLSPLEQTELSTYLTNWAANNYGGSKDPTFLATFHSYLGKSGNPANTLESFFPSPTVIEKAFGSNPTLMKSFAQSVVDNAENYINTVLIPQGGIGTTDDTDNLEHFNAMLATYDEVFGLMTPSNPEADLEHTLLQSSGGALRLPSGDEVKELILRTNPGLVEKQMGIMKLIRIGHQLGSRGGSLEHLNTISRRLIDYHQLSGLK